jgi:hypothetical protein
MTNKGLKLRFCKACNRNRFCKKEPIPDYNFKYTCSKGHAWILEGITLERITAVWADIVYPQIKNLFERDNIFYKELKRK